MYPELFCAFKTQKRGCETGDSGLRTQGPITPMRDSLTWRVVFFVVPQLLGSHLFEPGLIPGRALTDFRTWESSGQCRCQCVFSSISHFPCSFISLRCILISSQDLDFKSHPNLLTQINSTQHRIASALQDIIDLERVYTEVTFSIGSEIIGHALDDSAPIADLQGNKKRIPYCQMWGNTGATANEKTSECDVQPPGWLEQNRSDEFHPASTPLHKLLAWLPPRSTIGALCCIICIALVSRRAQSYTTPLAKSLQVNERTTEARQVISEKAAFTANSSRTRQQNEVAVQQHVGTTLVNQRLVTYSSAGSLVNKDPFAAHSSQSNTMPVSIASHRDAVAERLYCSPPTKGELGSIPDRFTARHTQVGIVPDEAAGRWVFSEFFRFLRPGIPTLLYSHHISPSLALKTSLLRAAQTSQFNSGNPARAEGREVSVKGLEFGELQVIHRPAPWDCFLHYPPRKQGELNGRTSRKLAVQQHDTPLAKIWKRPRRGSDPFRHGGGKRSNRSPTTTPGKKNNHAYLTQANKDSRHLNLETGGCIWLVRITTHDTPKAASSSLPDVPTWKLLPTSSAAVVENSPDPRFAPAYINPLCYISQLASFQLQWCRVDAIPGILDLFQTVGHGHAAVLGSVASSVSLRRQLRESPRTNVRRFHARFPKPLSRDHVQFRASTFPTWSGGGIFHRDTNTRTDLSRKRAPTTHINHVHVTSECCLVRGHPDEVDAGNKGRGKREILEKTRRPVASSGTIPTCENPGVSRPGMETCSPWREETG
ncbi:hypothetical protein PR048_012370 [Dryococelus australis]|uniref:Uncharacterized protein n=1 Tax=Dryococelus australis TaxID=614101 RepID=A0ABQ9HPX9_9NEOP|nr:hypothetical protein PR048_012370 [Dryococelus australis]